MSTRRGISTSISQDTSGEMKSELLRHFVIGHGDEVDERIAVRTQKSNRGVMAIPLLPHKLNQ